MAATPQAALTAELRAAIESLVEALVDPDAQPADVAAAHATIVHARETVTPIVATWIGDYVDGIASGTHIEDIASVVVDLARHFKLPTPGPCPRIGEQGTLFG